MAKWIRNVVPAMALAALVACGGGGGGGKLSNVEADKDFPVAAASQTYADAAVDELNGLVEDIHQAELSDSLPMAARIVGPPTGATYSDSLACSSFGTGGSGEMRYTFTYTNGGNPVSSKFTYDHCSFTNSGYTFTMNGTMTMKWLEYTDATHYKVTTTYDITYTYDGPNNYHEQSTLKSAQTCSQSGESFSCNYAVGGGYALSDYDVSVNGTIITIHHALIETANAEIEINNWVYNTSNGRATSGTIEVTYDNGNHVLITATGTGYTVAVTIGANTTNYTVTY